MTTDTDLLVDHAKADKKNKNTYLLVDHNVYVVFIYNLIQKMGVDDQFTSFISMAFVFFLIIYLEMY